MKSVVSLIVVMLLGLPSLTASAQPQPAGQTVSGRVIAALANKELRALHVDSMHTLSPAYSVMDQLVPRGALHMQTGSPLVTPAYINVPVTINVDGRFVRSVYVGYRVQTYVMQAVAAHDLVPGTVVADGDVKMARVPFTGRQPNSTEVLVGRKLVGAYVKGQSIFIESTNVDQIVTPGQSVVLTVVDGGVALTADVIARTGGGLGDQVSVFNPQTNKQLTGIVTGPGRVQLELPGGDAQ